MDEPTAVLAPQEIDDLFRTLRSMTARRPQRRVHQPQARRGHGHRRPDHGHAPRQGHGRRPRPRATTSRRDLARLMVGREILEAARADGRASPGAVVLVGPRRRRPTTTAGCRPCAASRCDVRAGEIVGHRGGRRQRPERAGRGHHGAAAVPRPRHDRRRRGRQPAGRRWPSAQGVAHVPEDRTGVGSVAEPVDHRQPDHEALPATRRSRTAGSSTTRAAALDGDAGSRTPTTSRRRRSTREARLLSGGNLQRLILAREIDAGADACMVAVQPTRGLDVGAIEARPPGPARARARRDRDPAHLRGPRRDPRRWPTASSSCTRAGSSARYPVDEADIGTIGLLMTGGASIAGDRPGRGRRRRRCVIHLEPRTTTPRWLSRGRDDRARWSSRSLVGGAHHLARRRRPGPLVHPHPRSRRSAASASSATRWSRRPR